jgi:L-threonylcarbamoyladenylate synthase
MSVETCPEARPAAKGLPQPQKLSRLSGTLKNKETEILQTHTAALFQAAVERAAELLRKGEVVALPTETVYGLAANAFDAGAVARIYEIKGRPAHNPIIVHVVGYEMVKKCVADWPPAASRLGESFWPGPLTLVLRRSGEIPDIVTAGGETVGVRWPSHPFIQAVIRKCGFPLAAPSANPSNRVSSTNAQHVEKNLGDKIRLIVDGGQSQVGIESAVVDLTASPPQILRPGIIHHASLSAALEKCGQKIIEGPEIDDGPVRSPGRLLKHYAPKAKLRIWSWQDERDLQKQLEKSPAGKTHVIAHTVIPSGLQSVAVSVIPHDMEAFARAIYAELHHCDDAGAERIIVEALPETAEWRAIADRLRRAAA